MRTYFRFPLKNSNFTVVSLFLNQIFKEVKNPLPDSNQTMKHKGEGLIDRNVDIFEPLLYSNYFYKITKVYFERFFNFHDYYHMWESNISQVVVPKTFKFLKSAICYAHNYVSSKISVMLFYGANVFFTFDYKYLFDILSLP